MPFSDPTSRSQIVDIQFDEAPGIPRTTPQTTRNIRSILILMEDDSTLEIDVVNGAGFYRESVQVIGNRKIDIQEVYITNGRKLDSE